MVETKKILKVEAYTKTNKLIISTSDFIITENENELLPNHVLMKGSIDKLPRTGQHLWLIFYLVNGNRIQYESSVSLCTEFQLNIDMDNNYIELNERRRFYKIKIKIDATITAVTDKDNKIVSDNCVYACIEDINIGGFYIDGTDLKLNISDVISVKFKLKNKELLLTSKVLRIQNKGQKDEGYGCAFVGNKPKDDEVIAQFIHEIERERMFAIKKQLEKH